MRPRLLRPQVEDWVERRVRDVLSREMEHSLKVGRDKPLGCRLVRGWDMCRELASILWRHGWHRRRRGVIASASPEGVWLYVWDQAALDDLLARNEVLLREVGWPCEAASFVQRTREERVTPGTELYVLIADLYGDRLNPGRPEICPGVPRHELLDAFHAAAGFPDPAAIFFASTIQVDA